MSHSLLLFCLWVVGANVAAMLPSRRDHLPTTFLLVCAGIPIVGYLTLQHGPGAGVLALAVGAAMLRWLASRVDRARRAD
ncbi:DUF2484 family protein [Roseitranquillus sediminis]|uniref:DUF2484 family protein n=1 Tax=Roseitranquillus sediminis TaxID=2809051 RepID=UPI001D0C3DE1|nr:DUF2484 family protein [Roseitranquillus sediminis]MBM9594605.1 DUF2484 family protein [Roseitranquillus sediminis]